MGCLGPVPATFLAFAFALFFLHCSMSFVSLCNHSPLRSCSSSSDHDLPDGGSGLPSVILFHIGPRTLISSVCQTLNFFQRFSALRSCSSFSFSSSSTNKKRSFIAL